MKAKDYLIAALQIGFGFWLIVIGDDFANVWMRIGCILTGFYIVIAGIWYISRKITNIW